MTSSPTQRELAIAADGSFVETTSESAARALATFYNQQDKLNKSRGSTTSSASTSTSTEVDEVEKCRYVITERRETNGRTIYRIKPRSRPPSPVKPSDGKPTFQFTESPPSPVQRRKPAASTPAKELRQSRSIPGLRSKSSVKTIKRDADGFWRPGPPSPEKGLAPGRANVPQLSHSPVTRLRAASSPNTGTPLAFRRSRDLLRNAKDGDVLGRLLGWASTPASETRTSSPMTLPEETVEDEEATVSLPPIFRDTPSAAEGLPADLLEELSSPPRTPLDSMLPVNGGTQAKTPSPPTDRSTPPKHPSPTTPLARSMNKGKGKMPASPFGDAVRGLNELSRSLNQRRRSDAAEPAPLLSPEQRTVHPVASNESVRTAKDGETGASTMGHRAKRRRYEDPTIFDVFQAIENQTESPSMLSAHDALSSAFTGQHDRTKSSASLASSTSVASSSGVKPNAHQIIICSGPGDDPRFAVRGEPPVGWKRRGWAAETTESLPLSNLTASSGSKRWSSKGRKGSISNGSDTTNRSDTSSPAPMMTEKEPKLMLVAATVERWVAELTSKIDEELLRDFFYTYRAFVSSHDLLRCLITRFHWALAPAFRPEDEAGKRIVRVRTYVVIRYWILNFFRDDFLADRELRSMLTTWLNAIAKDERVHGDIKNLQLIKTLKKNVRKLKATYTSIGGGGALSSPMPGINHSRGSLLDSSHGGRGSVRLSVVPETVNESLNGIDAKSPSLAPAIVLDDDVDLEIDIVVSPPLVSDGASSADGSPVRKATTYIPAASPPRLTRQSSAAALQFAASPSGSPSRVIRSGRSSGNSVLSSTSGSNFALPGSPLGLVGKLGRFKRMLGSRSNGTANEGLLLEQNEAGDMLHVQGGVDSYMEFIEANGGGQRHTGVSSDGTMSTSPTSSSGVDTPAEPDSDVAEADDRLHIVEDNGDEEGLGISYAQNIPRATSTTDDARELHHSTSSQTIKSEAPIAYMDTPPASLPPRPKRPVSSSSSSDVSTRPPLGAPRFRPLFASSFVSQNGSIDFSDSDGSDDEDDEPAMQAVRRMPNARNLRQAGAMRGLQSAFRRSVETISSIGTTRTPSVWQNNPFRRSRTASMSSDGSSFVPQAPGHGPATVKNFVVDGLESDDEEPGDVEAALRRLEGYVDEDKEREKAKRVEAQLNKSAAIAVNGSRGRKEGTSDEESEEEDDADRRSVAPSDAGTDVSSVPSEQPQTSSADTSLEQVAEPSTAAAQSVDTLPAPSLAESTDTAPPFTNLLAPPAPVNETKSLSLVNGLPPVQRDAHVISRKPSIRRFFTLPSSRPGSTTFGGPAATMPASRLRVPSPMSAPYRSFVFDYKTDVIAQQFCLIERDLLTHITWQELLGGSWKSRIGEEVLDWEGFLKSRARAAAEAKAKGEPVDSRAVQATIHRFNVVANWCTSEILLTTNLEARVQLINRMIQIAFKCLELQNLQTVMEITLALQSSHVQRLHDTWSRVRSKHVDNLEKLKSFTALPGNFRRLRQMMDKLSYKWSPLHAGSANELQLPAASIAGKADDVVNLDGVDLKIASMQGAIPFVGLYLRDLTMLEELSPYLDPSSPTKPPNERGADDSLPRPINEHAFDHLPTLPPDVSIRALVNVYKHRMVADTLQKVLVFQEMSQLYRFEVEHAVFMKCLKIRCLPIEAMHAQSLLCEPR